MNAGLAVDELTVSYGPVSAVSGVSLKVAAGEILAILGPNGAGKTSLVEGIIGRVRHGGTVHGPGGQSLTNSVTHQRVRAGLALVPQGRDLFRELTVQENLLLATRGLGRADAVTAVDEVYEQFPLLQRLVGRRAGYLSGGEQQTLAIARVLLVNPSVLILDEPSFGLSPSMRVAVLDVVVQLREEKGLAVLLTEQFADLALARADRAMVMAGGRCVWDGAARSLDRASLQQAYLGG